MVDPGHKAYRSQPCRFFAFGRGICRKADCRFGHFDLDGNDMRLAENSAPQPKRQKTENEEFEEGAPAIEIDDEISEEPLEDVEEEWQEVEDFEENEAGEKEESTIADIFF